MLTVKVTPDHGESFVVTASSRDVLTWEKTGKGRSQASFQNGIAMAEVYEIAYLAAKRQGLTELARLDFELGCDVELVDDEEEDPTNPGA